MSKKIGVHVSKRKIGVHKGMGFKEASEQIADKEGVSEDRAEAILAASTRNASSAAKKKNPNLKHVK